MGAFDHVIEFTTDAAYVECLGCAERQVAYRRNCPIALTVLLTIGVWGAVARSVSLLLRSRWAVPPPGLALVGQAALGVVTVAARSRWDVLRPRLSTQDVLVLLLTLGMLLYAVSAVSRVPAQERDSTSTDDQLRLPSIIGR